MKKETLKAYLFTYKIKGAGLYDVRSMVVIHYNEDEAQEFFKDFIKVAKFKTEFILMKQVKKNKLNKKFFSEEYYSKQYAHIEYLKKGQKENGTTKH